MSQATHSSNMAFITMATQPPSSGLTPSSSLLSTIVTSSMATTTPPSSVYPVAPPPDSQDPHAPPASQDGEDPTSNTSTAQPPKVTLMVRPKPVASESPSNSDPTPTPDGLTEEKEVAAAPENGTLSLTAHTSDSSLPRDEELCDDENPDVNLHDFLVQQLKEPKDRVFLLTLEDDLIKYVQDPSRNEQLRLPRYSSYHRMLAHRVAAYFGLIHNVDPFEKTCVIVTKGPLTRIPETRFTDHIPMTEDLDLSERKSILRRSREDFNSSSSSSGVASKVESMAMLPNSGPQASEGRSIEQREREYAEAKARIFNSSRESSLSKEEDSHSADNDGFGSEAGSEEGSQRSETVDATPIFYRGPTRKKREYRQTQPFQTYIAPYFRQIPTQYFPGGGAVYWPSHPQMYPSGTFVPQARPGGVGPMFISPSAGAYPLYMTSQPSPSLSPAHRGQPQPTMLLGPAPGTLGQYFPTQGSPGVLQLGKQQDVNQLSAQMAENFSLNPAPDNPQLAMLSDGNYEGVSPSNQQVGVTKPTSEPLVTTAQVVHKVQPKGQTPVLSHGHAPSPTHFQMGPYLVGMPYPNAGGPVQFVAGGNQYQQQNVQQHPMMPIPVSTQLPSGESPVPTATVPSPYLYQQVPASPLQQVASTQSFFPGVASMQQQGPPLFSPPGQSGGGGFMTLPSGLFSPPPTMMAPRPPENLTGYPPSHPTLAMARTRSGGTVEGGRKGEGVKAEDPIMQGVGTAVYTQELPPRFQQQQQHQHQQQQQQQHRGGGMRYQNQRHPANRAANRVSGDMQVHPGSSPRLSGVPQVSPQVIPRKEALLPTPPSNPVALSIVPHPGIAVAKPPPPRAPPPIEAILEFECKSQERAALTAELRNCRQASRVYAVKGNDFQVRAEYTHLELAQAALAHYRERNFKVTLLTPNKSPSRHAAVAAAQQS